MDFSLSPELDLDFDLEDDKISKFLQNKLEEIKAKNEKIKIALEQRRQVSSATSKSSSNEMEDNGIIIRPEVWKRVFNDKYVLGITIENKGSSRVSNPKTVLKWDSSTPLLYRVFLYEEYNVPQLKTPKSPVFVCKNANCDGITNSLKQSDLVRKLTHLVVILECPKFTEALSFEISGDIILQTDHKNVALVFPVVEISVCDSTNHHLFNYYFSNGDIKDILTLISCNEQTELVLILPKDWTNSFDSTLEILCSFTKVNAPIGCRKLFVAHKLSPHFDDSLLIFHAPVEANVHTYDFTVYSRNEDSLLSLLHHIHQNVPGAILIPKAQYENYIQAHPENISIERETSGLKACLRREMQVVGAFLDESQEARKLSREEFHRKLVDIQRESDKHYLRLSNQGE